MAVEQAKNPEGRISRREFLRLSILALSTASCSGSEAKIKAYYPELKDYHVKEQGQTKTPFGTTTSYYNLSDLRINPPVMEINLTYFENLAQKGWLINYKIDNNLIPFQLDTKPRNERVIFIVPEDAPSPNWAGIGINTNAATTGKFINKPSISFIRIFNSSENLPPGSAFNNPIKDANRSFSIEACQSSIQVLSVTPEIAHLGQEIMCNSLGAAFALRQQEVPYSIYEKWAEKTGIRQSPSSPIFPLYVMTEDQYGEIPILGPLFFPRN